MTTGLDTDPLPLQNVRIIYSSISLPLPQSCLVLSRVSGQSCFCLLVIQAISGEAGTANPKTSASPLPKDVLETGQTEEQRFCLCIDVLFPLLVTEDDQLGVMFTLLDFTRVTLEDFHKFPPH